MYYYIIYNIKFQPTLYGTKIKNPNVTALRRYAVTSWTVVGDSLSLFAIT